MMAAPRLLYSVYLKPLPVLFARPRGQPPLSLAPQWRTVSTQAPEHFSKGQRGNFSQDKPHLHNPFTGDPFLQSVLKRFMPQEVCGEVFADLERFGERIVREIDELGRQAELEPPQHRPFNAWGERVDQLLTSPAWRRQHDISAEEGLISLAYERQHGAASRLHQVAKLFLYSPSSGLYSCPLAMTDGAAKLIESQNVPQLRGAYDHIISREPDNFWTSGQWMTEMKGGSDVAGGTDTVARGPDSDGLYRLSGYKWFTSATDSNMAFTLARIVNQDGTVNQGTDGLSLFYLETKDENGRYNNLEIQRLKDKLGTRQLPTAELLLDGTRAMLVGAEGRGIPNISPMLTITRLHNSISAAGAMRRIVQLSRDYATRRSAFRQTLVNHPLHMQTLARLEVETRGATVLVMEVARLLGLMDTDSASLEETALHRLLTPLVKLYTAKQAMMVISEGLESFGGAGYLEDTGLPTLLRDAQVLPIWEGTTNILSLDVLRVITKDTSREGLSQLINLTRARASNTEKLVACNLESIAQRLSDQADTVVRFMTRAGDEKVMPAAMRDISLSLAQIYIGGLLVEHACSGVQCPLKTVTAQRWMSKPLPLTRLEDYGEGPQALDSQLVMSGYTRH